jgi:2-iminobutanoate/2-iminopropanoate deaminase
MKKIETLHAPKAVGPYSQAVKAGPFLFISGQLPLHPRSNEIEEITIEGQTKQVFENIDAILKAAELTVHDVVRVEVYLKDISHTFAMNEIYKIYFTGPILPARHTLQVAKLPKDALIEVTCVAYQAS